jgi:hypothetical protein
MMLLFRERRNQEINALSATAAQGWTALFNGFAGENGEKVDPKIFLPFSTESSSSQERISPKTRSILTYLIDRNKLPPMLASAFRQLIEQ